MSDSSKIFVDHTLSFPPRREDIARGSFFDALHAAENWLLYQENALSEVFMAEGRDELPVEDYVNWWQGQQVRLGESRKHWLDLLAEAGWNLRGEVHYRSLAYLRPDLLDEYDFEHEENPTELPYTETTKSPRSVWWRCLREDEHRWRTSFYNRHVIGTKCPRCGKKGVSRREQAVFKALQRLLPELMSPGSVPRASVPRDQRRRHRAWRVDMLLPGAPTVVVEYDGAYWHRDAQAKDAEKSRDLEATGHLVIRIREHPLPAITPNDVLFAADLPADDVASLVHQRIVVLTDRDRREDGSGMVWEQAELFAPCGGENL
ncbi:zinc-ribbon domain-containing protein [Streptomyces cinnamoneus]|uniref:zinc-ribbon domain-containing protein n=1 Tax=Streptomyces cinnamoneus TaxID=53446 RepID=UPI003414F3E5